MAVGDWVPKDIHRVVLGDEIWIDGEWKMVTALGVPQGNKGHTLYCGRDSVFYPFNTTIMVKEK
jgi:hypothetical protein